ncbi:DUF5107 domain-containing protein [Arthrobacter sp. B2a2-09]|uniref:DUF5107 domain-containing protein n=1 Tax=Arthrobacter sp. B2a2-09 TaxID=2952822 RepID=UPI0022CD7322|nr:DUF5107 domain-containing protein [Arthrobacter sp. B2a2-09]MCZ9880970.1 DUF5107 domain-containing protein [Arthrobacter sp. B2a2-09]
MVKADMSVDPQSHPPKELHESLVPEGPTDAGGQSHIRLPPVPERYAADPVAAWSEPLLIDSYLPAEPSSYPAFLDSRVYQGSSGRVYPLPFHERISHTKQQHEWRAVHLENEWVRLVILPELGGRIHIGYDKTADYDFFYRNNVIKPALVGLAGPWLSGGVEFNWPQHHRPATFLPTDYAIEHEDDGSITVWCSDHDPFTRMKGMHGIRLRPDSSVIEARVRLYNRTDETQTFLWWANVAAAVNDNYQSFFPTDVNFVADHAKRAMATFPGVKGPYYGVDYPAQITEDRTDGDRLDWYRNIPVPTSYMVLSTEDDFFGGYDHGRGAGFVHWADRHIAPGKKQWTWGNSDFGHAWDRNLTDTDGPYVELMAGVYTDNQPDFSFLAPGETKTFSQFWYPIQDIGPAHQANLNAAVRLDIEAAETGTRIRIGVAATRAYDNAKITLTNRAGTVIHQVLEAIGPGQPFVTEFVTNAAYSLTDVTLTVGVGDSVLIRWRHRDPSPSDQEPQTATEPAAPGEIGTTEELFYTGQYLEQYRHATRSPEPYWEEALRRDPGDVRSNLAMAARLERGAQFPTAEAHLRRAITRLTHRVSNPADGEAHYRLGINLVHQGRDTEAHPLLAKAIWNAAWRVPAGHALARLHSRAGDYEACETALRDVLRLDSEHSQATCLLVLVLRAQGRGDEAQAVLEAQLQRDPLDHWALDLAGRPSTTDAPTLLDVALEYAETGFLDASLRVLGLAAAASGWTALGQVQVGPLVHYHRARILYSLGRRREALEALAVAKTTDARHCLPSRLADVSVLKAALRTDEHDGRAAALLGSWHYDKGSYYTAIALWKQAADNAPNAEDAAIVHRNLGIAAYNVLGDTRQAVDHFEIALAVAGGDAKLLYEYDQLLLRTDARDSSRLALLESHPGLVASRDDLTIVYANLLTLNGRAARARELLLNRCFQPWEGGEGQVLDAWEQSNKALAADALESGDPETARQFIGSALQPPQSLGEGRHPLANTADLYWLHGEAYARLGDDASARAWWQTAADSVGDFVNMSTKRFSTNTFWSILALRRLGRTQAAKELAEDLGSYVNELASTPATVDFFATSLPSMLLFHDDPQEARNREVEVLTAQLAELAASNDQPSGKLAQPFPA